MVNYVIGIGGTGAKCVEAFVCLLGAGLLKDNSDVKVLFIDVDSTCGNLERSIELVKNYKEVQEFAKIANDNNSGIFKNKIDFKSEKDLKWIPVSNDNVAFENIIEINTLESQCPEKALLFKSLFTEQERTTKLKVGFRGHPNIGSGIMSLTIEQLKEGGYFAPIEDNEQNVRVFIFGSAYGGTGAAGFPTVAKWLSDSFKDTKIGGTLVLPYFTFEKNTDEKEKNEMQAKVSEFLLNTKAALLHYANSEQLTFLDRLYLVGNEEFSEVGKFSLGSNTQKNRAHYVEMIAALSAFDFFNAEEGDFPNANPYFCVRKVRENNDKAVIWDDLPADGKKIKDFVKFLMALNGYVVPLLKKEKQIDSSTLMSCINKVLSKINPANGGKRSLWVKNILGDSMIVDETFWSKNVVSIEKFYQKVFIWLHQLTCDDNLKIIRKECLPTKIIKENGEIVIDLDKTYTDDYNFADVIISNDTDKITGVTLGEKLNNVEAKNVSQKGLACLIDNVYKIVANVK